MKTHNLGYPRIGNQRELKKAIEGYWNGKHSAQELQKVGKQIRSQNWALQAASGIDIIPCNDFSYYDQVLDMCMITGAIPQRFHDLMQDKQLPEIDLMFAMARGYQSETYDIKAMEMTKWFDTNYHYIVPEFTKNQKFCLYANKILHEYCEAVGAGISAKPVILGPVSFLLLGKSKEPSFNRLELLNNLLPVYMEILQQLDAENAYYVQFDEPCLAKDLTVEELAAFKKVYSAIRNRFPQLHIVLASYFECYGAHLDTVLTLPVNTLHLDLVRCPSQLQDILATDFVASHRQLSLGIVDGRNIWKNDYVASLCLIQQARQVLGAERLLIAPSCSLLHVPCDVEMEDSEQPGSSIINWLAFAKQKLVEVAELRTLALDGAIMQLVQTQEQTVIAHKVLEQATELDAINNGHTSDAPRSGHRGNYTRELAFKLSKLRVNILTIADRKNSTQIHNPAVKAAIAGITAADSTRNNPFVIRKTKQQESLALPLFPTTTIGSFPQTATVRSWRSKLKKNAITQAAYDDFIAQETEAGISWQEAVGLDVLVHGEFERNDMVEYFGEQLAGFAFTGNGWVQSYGTRCVKPPIIFGDVERLQPMTVKWTTYAQSLTNKWVKGMLTGPVTMLQWSFVRNDQPRSTTCAQIALAIRAEVQDLEAAGIKLIQIDEPALREGLPLRKENWAAYLDWAVHAFRLSSSGVADTTQIHTHMCYSEFNDIMPHIAALDADVITIECAKSQMQLLDAFAAFKYPNDIGPGVYDIHAPRVPSIPEMKVFMQKAMAVIPPSQLWVNPDCGLKTRNWPETKAAVELMVLTAKALRADALRAEALL